MKVDGFLEFWSSLFTFYMSAEKSDNGWQKVAPLIASIAGLVLLAGFVLYKAIRVTICLP